MCVRSALPSEKHSKLAMATAIQRVDPEFLVVSWLLLPGAAQRFRSGK
jgi:hypothetical protein